MKELDVDVFFSFFFFVPPTPCRQPAGCVIRKVSATTEFTTDRYGGGRGVAHRGERTYTPSGACVRTYLRRRGKHGKWIKPIASLNASLRKSNLIGDLSALLLCASCYGESRTCCRVTLFFLSRLRPFFTCRSQIFY